MIPASNPMKAPTIPIYWMPSIFTVCPPIKEPNPIPRLKMPEKIDIATEELSFPCNMISDCAATLNAVDVHPQHAHTMSSVIRVIEDGFNKNNTIAILLVKILKKVILFLE